MRESQTFVIKVLQTENDGWQGQITWANQKKTKSFRSALEMIKMIDGAMVEDNRKGIEKKEKS